MLARTWAALYCLVAVTGCGANAGEAVSAGVKSATSVRVSQADHATVLYDQLRTGTYQLSSAQDSLATNTEMARMLSQKAGGTAGQGFHDLLTKLEAAGNKLGDYTEEPPSPTQFRADLDAQDERRLSAIDAGNDALGDLADAQDIVEGLLAGAPPDVKPSVQKMQRGLDDAVDAVETGVKAMGGKLDGDTPNPDS